MACCGRGSASANDTGGGLWGSSDGSGYVSDVRTAGSYSAPAAPASGFDAVKNWWHGLPLWIKVVAIVGGGYVVIHYWDDP